MARPKPKSEAAVEALAWRSAEKYALDGNDPEVRRKAALVICGRARNTDDARHLLDACGLADLAPRGG